MKKSSTKQSLIYISILAAGILVGGYLFRDVQPRSLLNVDNCNNTCLKPNELIGLAASVGIARTDTLPLKIIRETELSIAIEHPIPSSPYHYVLIPKRDISDIAALSEEDQESIDDILALIGVIVREEGLTDYFIRTNGIGYQDVNYLHFHLQAEE